MEILLWLVPAAVVTAVAMLVVGWFGREERGQVDRETAARLLGEALSGEQRRGPGYAVPRRAPERSTGVALRPSRQRPVLLQGEIAGEPTSKDTGEAKPRGDRGRQAS